MPSISFRDSESPATPPSAANPPHRAQGASTNTKKSAAIMPKPPLKPFKNECSCCCPSITYLQLSGGTTLVPPFRFLPSKQTSPMDGVRTTPSRLEGCVGGRKSQNDRNSMKTTASVRPGTMSRRRETPHPPKSAKTRHFGTDHRLTPHLSVVFCNIASTRGVPKHDNLS